VAASGGFLSSPRRRRRLAWGSGIASFLGGLVAVALLWPDVERVPETMSTEPAVVLTSPRDVVLTKDVRAATIDAGNVFLKTAVKRDHPERAWDVVHPALREGYTKASWATGDIPVVPYPVDAAIYRLDYSHPNLVGWKVSVYPPKGSTQQAMTFYMDVTLSGSGGERRWRVSNWSPASMLSTASGGSAAAQQGSSPYAIGRQAGDDLESRVNPLWLLLAFVPLAFVVIVVGAKGVRDWRRTAAVERAYRSTSNPS
jgi:hypothetical protein